MSSQSQVKTNDGRKASSLSMMQPTGRNSQLANCKENVTEYRRPSLTVKQQTVAPISVFLLLSLSQSLSVCQSLVLSLPPSLYLVLSHSLSLFSSLHLTLSFPLPALYPSFFLPLSSNLQTFLSASHSHYEQQFSNIKMFSQEAYVGKNKLTAVNQTNNLAEDC